MSEMNGGGREVEKGDARLKIAHLFLELRNHSIVKSFTTKERAKVTVNGVQQ